MPDDVDNRLHHYAIEGWLHHITHEKDWLAKPTKKNKKGKARDWFTPALHANAKRIRMFALNASMGSVVDQNPFPELGELRPALYLDSLAERLAGPFWGRYTERQRMLVRQFAAGYLAQKVEREEKAAEQRMSWTKAERKASRNWGRDQSEAARKYRWARIGTAMRANELERRLTLVRAYLAAHDDHDVVPAELRELTRLTFGAEGRSGAAHPRDLPFF